MTQRERFEEWATLRQMDISFFIPPAGHSGFYGSEETQTAWDAWQAACPEGWQVVPKEPSEEMIESTKAEYMEDVQYHLEIYRAMLQAAPKPGDE